ncbi:family A G protein-coupled receptor-like protein [Conidiobolus coronatus NRRL 28638]|uniref:Family A G protein-coupled receptor-like protein n=1 Tax=Conidiobolus coronatus (strain ATCC 28846 / CBS 209.66 / NRRL 28638) TaxID=796925 RepID=A0A137PHN4_CONC2|nr:family A G protein-coupled receptor-like protein [Conidiobolus coronatus NRRL 28638]|eukprot:KXN74516.1 family A G protein-coupled receptor-like protein [Conidiobolus coronatus NRRL 28638]
MEDPVYILSNPSVTLGTEITLFVICILGLFLNGLAVYITLSSHSSRNLAIRLMLFIAITDILFSIHGIASQIAKWATSQQVLLDPWFCQSNGMFNTLLTMSSTDGVGLLSLLRALSVAGNIKMREAYWYTAMGVLVLANTSFSIVAAFYEIMRIMPSEAYCQASFTKNTLSVIYSLFMMGKFAIVLLLIIASYIYITIRFYQTATRFSSKGNGVSSSLIDDRTTTTYQKWVLLRILIFVFMYMVCFAPELIALVYNLSTKTDRSPILDSIVSVGIFLTIIVNSVFLLFYNQENRKVLINMLPSWIRFYSDNLEMQELSSL